MGTVPVAFEEDLKMGANCVGGIAHFELARELGERTATSHTYSFGSANNSYEFRMMDLFKRTIKNDIELVL